jgi:hypothetical protein
VSEKIRSFARNWLIIAHIYVFWLDFGTKTYEHDLIVERYEKCLEILVEEELTKAYF